MEASQLKIAPEHLRFKPMPRAEKLRLRRENIKAYIKSKPAGTVITMSEFAKVSAQLEQNAYSMIKTMIKRGDIIKITSEGHGQRYTYVVNELTDKVVKHSKSVPRYDIASLKQMAKEFAWQEDSDSLRKFIQSLDKGKSHEGNNLPAGKSEKGGGNDQNSAVHQQG